ncbi:MAG: ribosome-associated translation inhibitor RaiA [Micropepsaceae bacterium]
MHIQVSGQQIDIGDALRTHVDEKLNTGVAKYFDHTLDAVVSFTRERERFLCNVAVHVYSGLTMRADAAATEIYASFDAAAARIEKQLRRHKSRIKAHKGRGPAADESLAAQYYVIDGEAEEAASGDDPKPAIIAESPAAVATLRVGDAVMQLDLTGAPVLLFRNAGNGGLNVVYRRADGHVGWIDPAFDPVRA